MGLLSLRALPPPSLKQKDKIKNTRNPQGSDFLFPLQPPPPPIPTNPPGRPTQSACFGPFRLRFGPFVSVWLRLAPFRVCFGSVSGPFRGVGWGRGGVGERGFCMGKEYHYPKDPAILKMLRSQYFTTVVAKHYGGSKTLRQGL